jgi:hypothetical protein
MSRPMATGIRHSWWNILRDTLRKVVNLVVQLRIVFNLTHVSPKVIQLIETSNGEAAVVQ